MKMDWLGTGIDGPLVVIRATHFAVISMTVGCLSFRAVAADPAFSASTPAASSFRARTLRLACFGLAISAVTGVIWLLLEAASMSGLSLEDAMATDALWTVVNETQFGRISEIRLLLAVMLAGCLRLDRVPFARGLALAAALGLTAAMAWTGHAGATPDEMGILHLAADTLHLCGVAIWIGGLVALVLLLLVARSDRTVANMSFARQATERFSTIAVASVVVVLATGIVNAWVLVGSMQVLRVTGYGQLLMLKMALFAAMLLFAAANRFRLMPQLAVPPGNALSYEANRLLARNSIIEIALALSIFAIVGMLGTLHPAIHGLLPAIPVQQLSR